jgi:hypothetical protein
VKVRGRSRATLELFLGSAEPDQAPRHRSR